MRDVWANRLDSPTSNAEEANHSNYWVIDKSTKIQQRFSDDYLWADLHKTTGMDGIGIQTPLFNNTISQMELSFGSILPPTTVDVFNETPMDPYEGFFGIGKTSGNDRYMDQAAVVDNLNSGFQFRWVEDPYENIYTIQPGSVGEKSVWRYSDFNKVTQPDNISTGIPTMYHHPANFGKNYKFDIRPNMYITGWNPVQGFSLPNLPVTHTGAGGSMIGPKRVTLTASSHTGVPGGDQIVDNNAANASTCRVFVTSIEQTHPTLGPQVLEVGMCLKQHSGTTAVPTQPLVVKRIVKTSAGQYSVFLSGYKYVLNSTKGVASVNFDPNHGQDLVFEQFQMNGLTPDSAEYINKVWECEGCISAVGYTLEFLAPSVPDEVLPDDPAVWETEPKESTDLDIYYEASSEYPIILDNSTIDVALPLGSIVTSLSGGHIPINTTIVKNNLDPFGNKIQLSNSVCCGGPATFTDPITGELLIAVSEGDFLEIERPDGSKITVQVAGILSDVFTNDTIIQLETNLYQSWCSLNWHNCYTFGNGVESNRIRDNFNLPFISNGVVASTTLEEQYKEENRKYGLIYSGIYNSISGVNNLNQFIQAEKITKDINPIYGSIQKLHTRDTNLVTLCEDKCLKILANKDALFNADGNTNVTATENVLGQTIPFVGEFGISKNPESFAAEAYRAYFTDRQRGVVLRLSQDGITPISMHGMEDWFRDNLKLTNHFIGSFDKHKREYNLTLSNIDDISYAPTTLTFDEKVKGWVSFKSFIQEHGISLGSDYFTFKGGELYQHHTPGSYNTFYNLSQESLPSSVTVLFNEVSGTVKDFNTVKYEGSQSRIISNTFDNRYSNLTNTNGWFVEYISTNLQSGSVPEFIEKEGMFYNYIKGDNELDIDEFSFQGIGGFESVIGPAPTYTLEIKDIADEDPV